MPGYDEPLSRPIRKVAADISGGSVTILGRATRIATITVTPGSGDAVVDFRNGVGGEILWTIEADNASGSHTAPFGVHPLLFTKGIVAEVNNVNFIQAICVAVVEPQSSGT